MSLSSLIRAVVIIATILSVLGAETSTPMASSAFKNILSSLKHVMILSPLGLKELRNSSFISIVYFVVKDMPNHKAFFEEFDKSAKYLEIYNVRLAVFDCMSDTSGEPMCKQERVEHHVYTYQAGTELLTLEVETMFDVDSIMSNALQLVLLEEVPIIQSRLERQNLQMLLAGKQDMFLAYTTALGTYGHRVFMEIAYTFQDRFKFAVTTDLKSVEGLQFSDHLPPSAELGLWVLFCSEVTEAVVAQSGECRSHAYRGDQSLPAFDKFMKNLYEPVLFNAPTEGITTLFNMPSNGPLVFVYSNSDVEPVVMPVLEPLSTDLRGYTKIIAVDMDNEECKNQAMQQGFHDHLPTIAVKDREGKVTFMDQNTEWGLENIYDFLLKLVLQQPGSTDEKVEIVPSSTDLDTSVADYNLIDEVEFQDDQVAMAVFVNVMKKMELDHVPALFKSSFYEVAKPAELLLVLFYLPFDHVSLAFLRDFGHASMTLAKNFSDTNVLARVNCYDATDLCGAENITTYPLLRIYKKGQDHQVYNGALDAESVVKAVKLLQMNFPVMLNSEEEVEKFMKGEHPMKYSQFTPSSVLLLASSMNTGLSDVAKVFNDVARSLSSMTAFGIVQDKLVKSVAQKYEVTTPAVVVHHHNDRNKPIRTLTEEIDRPKLTYFVKQSLLPALPELTMMNFPTVFARNQPFCILFLDPAAAVSAAAVATFTRVAMSDKFPSISFCWMNAQEKSVGLKILSEYTWTASLPMITVVDHKQAEVFSFGAEELKEEEFVVWLDRVVSGNERPSKKLKTVEWVPTRRHYDFLAMMDADNKKHGQRLGIPGDYIFEEEERLRTMAEEKSTAQPEEQSQKMESEILEELTEMKNSRLHHQNPTRKQSMKQDAAGQNQIRHDPMLQKENEVDGSMKQDPETVKESHVHSHGEL